MVSHRPDRLFYLQTLTSARRSLQYSPNSAVPLDSLDFVLQSCYNHSENVFPNKVDILIQRDSIGEKTFRVSRNNVKVKKEAQSSLEHPLVIGGTTEKIAMHSIKLINSGHHSQLTNNGFSRQPADGNFFHY